MATGIPINGAVLRDLRTRRALSQEALALRCGINREEISAYERGRAPSAAHLERIVAELELTEEQRCALIPAHALDAALAALRRKAREIEELMAFLNRRQFAQIAAAGTGAVILSPAGAPLPPRLLHDDTIALAARYPTTSPVQLLPAARDHLNRLTDALSRPLAGERRMLLVDAAETASLAARCAREAGYRGEAAAFFGHAQSLADESRYDTLIGCTRIAAAAVHGPLAAGGNGDWVTALPMLTSGAALVGSSGPRAKWAAWTLAEQYADLSREPEARRSLGRFEALPLTEYGDGFFSLRSRFDGYDAPGHGPGVAGRCLALLHRSDEALACLAQSSRGCERDEMAYHSDVALTHACGGDPEAMCAAVHALLQIPHNALAVAEIRGARAKLLEPCADAECVRELDERLATL